MIKNYIKIDWNELKNDGLFIEITNIFKKLDIDIYNLDFQILYNFFDLVNNSTDIFPIKGKTLLTFEKLYIPSQIFSFNQELYLFGGTAKKFPLSIFQKLHMDDTTSIVRLKDLPLASKYNIVVLDDTKENFFWISILKKYLQIHKYRINDNIWEEISLKKTMKFEEITFFMTFTNQMQVLIFSKTSSFMLDLKVFEVKTLETKNFEDLNEKVSFFSNFQLRKNSIKFIKIEKTSKYLALNNIFINKKLNKYYFSYLLLRDVKSPLSLDKSIDKKLRRKPIILEDKPILNIIEILTYFPFSELSLGKLFFNEKNIFTILSRKIDNSLESFDDIFEGAKLMFFLNHKNILKLKDFYVVSMEILFLYKGVYEDLYIIKEKNSKTKIFPTSEEIFQLLYETVTALEYLKSNKMFFFEVNLRNILISRSEKNTYKLINYEYEMNISRNQFYFENRKLFTYLPPMPPLEEFHPEDEKIETFTSLNLDIHKSNIYSLGLSCVSFASNEDLVEFNNNTDYLHIQNIIESLKYPPEIKEILANMTNIDEDLRWDSWNLLNKLKNLKKSFAEKPDFKNLKNHVKNQNNAIFQSDGFVLLYKNDEFLRYLIVFDDNSKFIYTNLSNYCYDAQTSNIYMFYFTNSLNFFQGSFEKEKISFKKLEKPGFLDNGNQSYELNCLSIKGFIYILGYKYKTAQGVAICKNFYCFDISANKWLNYITIPENINDFCYFTENHKIFLISCIKNKLKLYSFDVYKTVWEVSKLRFSRNIQRYYIEFMENQSKFDFISIDIKYPLNGLFDMRKNEIFLINLEKCKVFNHKKVYGVKEDGYNPNNEKDCVIYKNLQKIDGKIMVLTLVMTEEGQEIYIKKKIL